MAPVRQTGGTGGRGNRRASRRRRRRPTGALSTAFATPSAARRTRSWTQLLENAHRTALQVSVGAGGGPIGAELAAIAYASDALVLLAAEGELTTEDVHAAAAALALALDRDLKAMRFVLLSNAVASPRLLELPPLAGSGHPDPAAARPRAVQGRVALAARDQRSTGVRPHSSGREKSDVGHAPRRAPSCAAVPACSSSGRASLRSAPIVRFDHVVGAVIAQVAGDDRDRDSAFLAAVATALGPVLERELLLDRSRAREHALVASAERRLVRLGFDLHDGPIQDVLALAADMSHLQQQMYPFVLESHRELAFGRFDDLGARLGELDRALREIAHSLESKSIVSRPLGEILHREVDAFAARSGIVARLDVRGDPESLTSSARIALFRAVQEALSNVREHSGATEVEIRLRARRNSIDVRITDNGAGFEVSHALARAAKRGRLGVVGIGERVRMLGGTFDLDSQPGGPTTLSLTLPRFRPDDFPHT